MARGFKIADAYVEITTDKSSLRDGVRRLPSEVGPDADRAGQVIGDRITKGLAQSVERLSIQVEKARRREVEAFAAVHLAQTRLNEVRATGVLTGSKVLALEQKLTKAKYDQQAATGALAGATNKLTDAQKQLAVEMENIERNTGPAADRAGKGLGDKLSQGLHMSIVRNSPLIVAAIGAALMAGAPLALAAATAMFAGIGIVAAAQSDKVKSSWLGTWQQIKAGAISDARPIEATLVKLASTVASSFERIRPSLRNIFADTAPQVEVLTKGLLGLVENALPGLERAISRNMPVVQGLADFLEKTGTGLTGFFDGMSEHAPAAGRAFALIGDVIAELLPMLGTLLGQGAELATMVLPPVVGALKAVNAILGSVGGLLPVVLTSFMAYKALSGVSSIVQRFGSSITGIVAPTSQATAGLGLMQRGAMGIVGALGGPWGAALAGAGILIGLYTAQIEKSRAVQDEWTQAFVAGGTAANQAMAEYEESRNRIADTAIGGWLQDVDEWLGLKPSIDDAREASDKYLAGLDPLARAQQGVTKAQNELSEAVEKYGPDSDEAARASHDLADAQAEVARIAAEEERAIRGVTEAMTEQLNAARARVDADFAYANSLNAVEDAQAALNDVRKDGKSTAEDIERAELALAQAYDAQVRDAGRVATEALPAMLDARQKQVLGAQAELAELEKVRAAYGGTLPPALEKYRQSLIATTGQANGSVLAQAALTAALGEVGVAVTSIPNSKSVRVEALTEEAIKRLRDLGLTVEQQPDGSFKVTAETQEAMNNLGQVGSALAGVDKTVSKPTVAPVLNPFQQAMSLANTGLNALGIRVATPTANLNTAPFSSQHHYAMGTLGYLGGQRPTPTADLNTGPFAGGANWMHGVMSGLGNSRPSPVATLYANTGSAEWALNNAARNRVSYVTQYVRIASSLKYGSGTMATGGKIGDAVRGFDLGGTPKRRSDGRIVGPGGGTDDLVPAITNTGEPLRVSNTEWIINAITSARQGDAKMAALNAGEADIVFREPNRPARRFADGGSPSVPPAAGQQSPSDRMSLAVGQMHLHLHGVDVRDQAEARRFVDWVEDELVKRTRERS